MPSVRHGSIKLSPPWRSLRTVRREVHQQRAAVPTLTVQSFEDPRLGEIHLLGRLSGARAKRPAEITLNPPELARIDFGAFLNISRVFVTLQLACTEPYACLLVQALPTRPGGSRGTTGAAGSTHLGEPYSSPRAGKRILPVSHVRRRGRRTRRHDAVRPRFLFDPLASA